MAGRHERQEEVDRRWLRPSRGNGEPKVHTRCGGAMRAHRWKAKVNLFGESRGAMADDGTGFSSQRAVNLTRIDISR